MEPAPPVETKVKAATAGAAVAGLVVWLLEAYVFPGEVPQAVQAVVDVVVPGVVALAAGWWARHTPRPGAPPVEVDKNPPAGV